MIECGRQSSPVCAHAHRARGCARASVVAGAVFGPAGARPHAVAAARSPLTRRGGGSLIGAARVAGGRLRRAFSRARTFSFLDGGDRSRLLAPRLPLAHVAL